MSHTPRNPVLFLLVLAGIGACLGTGFLTEAPNRLVSGVPLMLWEVTGGATRAEIAILGATVVVFSFLMPTRSRQIATLAAAVALWLLLCYAAGHGAAALMREARPATRIGLGLAFWVAIFCLAMIMLDTLLRMAAGAAIRALAVGALLTGLAVMLMVGTFDQLSIMREYATRRDVFETELVQHIMLVLSSALIAIAIGVPLGLLAARKPAFASGIFGALNLLQTIPSIALFGLLIAPLSALAASLPLLATLGIGGIGMAPAITALVLYALLPMVRNTHAAIIGIDPALIDAARGLGLSPGQIFRHVEFPLGLPTVIAGLRVMLVQTIGTAVVAALIGAGGLGTFVFQGIGQYATDLVLLGAIPAILLALAADFGLTLTLLLLSRRPTP